MAKIIVRQIKQVSQIQELSFTDTNSEALLSKVGASSSKSSYLIIQPEFIPGFSRMEKITKTLLRLKFQLYPSALRWVEQK